MKERKHTVNIVKANVFGIFIFVAVAFVVAVLWYIIWGDKDILLAPDDGLSDKEELIWLGMYFAKLFSVILAFMGCIVVHELIHGITWAHYAKKGWKSISFGVIWKLLTPYCHCSEPLKVRHYIIGALMPLIILGILPLILGLSIGSIIIVIFGVLLITGACGDVLVVWKLRNERSTATVLDHPTEAGCIIYEEE